MATETELLIWGYNEFERQMQVHLEQIQQLRQMKQEIKDKMPRLHYIEGYGQEGLAARVHFVGTENECKAWVSHNVNLEVMDNGVQIRNKHTPPVGTHLIAGIIDSVTPIDKKWREISSLKGGDDALPNSNP